MPPFGEPAWRRREREARQRNEYADLGGAPADIVMAVDQRRRQRGAPLTSLGQAAEREFATGWADQQDPYRAKLRARQVRVGRGASEAQYGGREPSYDVPDPRGAGEALRAAGRYPELLANVSGLSLASVTGLGPPPDIRTEEEIAAGVPARKGPVSNWPTPFRILAEEATRPINYTPAGVVRKLGLAGELARGVVASVAGRAAAEGVGEALPEDVPLWLRGGAQITAGLLAGGGTYGAAGGIPRAARATGAYTRDVARAANAPSPLRADETLGAVIAPRAVIPGPVRVRAGAAEAGERTGTLLRPRGAEQLGADYTVKDALGVATDLRRQASSAAQNVHAEGSLAIRELGDTVKDSAGNLRLRGVISSDGSPALMQDVLENPGRYPLTPQQAGAVERFAGLFAKVKNERAAFGVELHEVGLEEGQNFVSRMAKENVKGQKLRTGGGGTGTRLGVPREKSRVFDDALEATRAGVVYEHPLAALDRYTGASLKRAGDAHVKSLLVPFSETSAARVPPALRAQHDALVQRLGSLKGTESRLMEGHLKARLAATVDSYINAAEPDLDALYTELDALYVAARSDLRRVGGAGTTGRTVPQVRADIAAVKQQIRDLRPAWKDAVERSKATPSGRARIPIDVAPALAGRDFADEQVGIFGRLKRTDASRITRFYSRGVTPQNTYGTTLRGITAFNRVVIPTQAIGDASATLNQLAAVAPSHPLTFGRNFVRSFADAVQPKRYDEFIAREGQDGASHGLAILGKVGDRTEFEFGTWFERVPGLKQLQQQFRSITTRNRVDIYNQLVDTAEKTGAPLDDLGKEQVARALNRVSGISTSRATDVETLAQFAPNFLRAHIETLGKAAADGTLEGQLARQYIKNLTAFALTTATGVALAQGRDVREVLQPIEVTSDGGVRMNPNFATVRVAGQDVSLFGPYDSLARLAVVGIDAGYRSIRDQDAMQLADFIGYAAGTKGSPLVKQLTGAIEGETFSGAEPFSREAAVEALTPFTVSAFMQDIREGQTAGTAGIGAGVSFFGGKANPLSPRERVQEGDYAELGPQLQLKAMSSEAWQVAKDALGDDARSYYEWRKAFINDTYETFIDAGLPEVEARREAEKQADRQPQSKIYSDVRNRLQTQWVASYPQEARALFEREGNLPPSERRFTPNKEELALIGATQ